MARVLIVDDSSLSRAMVAKALKDAGYEAVEAVDGQAGIAAFDSQPFDCVVTDLLMPVLDGQQLLTHVREVNPRIPVVVLTADIQASTREMCAELAVNAFVNKPVKAKVVQACVAKALLQAQGAPAWI
jgi:CheY-like chemotaxis protein